MDWVRFALLLAAIACSGCSKNAVELRPVSPPAYPDSVRPGALRWACASGISDLAAFFNQRQLPFVSAMARVKGEQKCHLYYEPTVRGFRAVPDDAPVTELLASLDTLSFLAKRSEVIGDGLDILKQALPRSPRPLQITLALGGDVEDRYYSDAIAHHFPSSGHKFRRYSTATEDYDPWMQDMLKYGSTGSTVRILVTRQAYEGKANTGSDLLPMLTSLKDERFARSNLSWEGGDLQFALDPRDATKLVLFYGTTAKRYWGAELTRDEFAYVLKIEFGADTLVYLGDVTPHVDYALGILPADRIALVSTPICGNRELARSALDVLLATYGPDTPPELRQIEHLWTKTDATGLDQAQEWLQRAKQAEGGWARKADKDVVSKIDSYLVAACPKDPKACLRGTGLAGLLTQHLSLLQSWVKAETRASTERHLARRMLAVIEGQLSPCNPSMEERLRANAMLLEQMGYRTIRVPYIPGSAAKMAEWAGISYINAVAVDRTLFVPQFGLGRIEKAWFDTLARDLPESYRVVPVQARAVLLANGGVHCVTAIGRNPSYHRW